MTHLTTLVEAVGVVILLTKEYYREITHADG